MHAGQGVQARTRVTPRTLPPPSAHPTSPFGQRAKSSRSATRTGAGTGTSTIAPVAREARVGRGPARSRPPCGSTRRVAGVRGEAAQHSPLMVPPRAPVLRVTEVRHVDLPGPQHAPLVAPAVHPARAFDLRGWIVD